MSVTEITVTQYLVPFVCIWVVFFFYDEVYNFLCVYKLYMLQPIMK